MSEGAGSRPPSGQGLLRAVEAFLEAHRDYLCCEGENLDESVAAAAQRRWVEAMTALSDELRQVAEAKFRKLMSHRGSWSNQEIPDLEDVVQDAWTSFLPEQHLDDARAARDSLWAVLDKGIAELASRYRVWMPEPDDRAPKSRVRNPDPAMLLGAEPWSTAEEPDEPSEEPFEETQRLQERLDRVLAAICSEVASKPRVRDAERMAYAFYQRAILGKSSREILASKEHHFSSESQINQHVRRYRRDVIKLLRKGSFDEEDSAALTRVLQRTRDQAYKARPELLTAEELSRRLLPALQRLESIVESHYKLQDVARKRWVCLLLHVWKLPPDVLLAMVCPGRTFESPAAARSTYVYGYAARYLEFLGRALARFCNYLPEADRELLSRFVVPGGA